MPKKKKKLVKNHGKWDYHPYFNTSELLNAPKTKAQLLNGGFREVSFTSSDGLKLEGLYLERPNATVNVLVCAGYTVNLECMAPLSLMLPKYCNILIFNRRDNSNITSLRFIKQFYNYGGHQYKDVLAALDFLYLQNNNKIVMLGMSAGTYHSIHALRKLNEWGLLEQYKVAGLIYDSGIASILEAAQSLLKAPNQLTDYVHGFDLKVLLFRLQHKLNHTPTSLLFGMNHIVKLGAIDKKISIIKQVETLNIPIFYIHAEKDRFPIDVVKNLDRHTKNSHHWWIQGGGHAVNHLKRKYEYSRRITDMINLWCT